ncbi:hypothetical protein GCM10009426_22220 [Rheinheimera tangshanensis]|nr:hypothetical protein GCM10010920_22400 [Rheinheimera tangshanensis]
MKRGIEVPDKDCDLDLECSSAVTCQNIAITTIKVGKAGIVPELKRFKSDG